MLMLTVLYLMLVPMRVPMRARPQASGPPPEPRLPRPGSLLALSAISYQNTITLPVHHTAHSCMVAPVPARRPRASFPATTVRFARTLRNP